MNTVSSPYFDPDFDSLSERVNGPQCRVTVGNETLEDCTVLMIDGMDKKGLLLELIQGITDMNLTILKAYVSFDAGWYMDVFHVKEENGNKIREEKVINYIEKVVSAGRESSSRGTSRTETTGIELTGKDRPGLLSEISATLADLRINIIEAHAWSHNSRLACVAYISDQNDNSRIDDNRLATIEHHLTTVLRATSFPPSSSTIYGNSGSTGEECINNKYQNKVEKTRAAGGGLVDVEELGTCTTTDVERRLHQLMFSVRDFDRPATATAKRSKSLPAMRLPSLNKEEEEEEEEEGEEEGEEEKRNTSVTIESCDEKEYNIVMVHSKDRRRLMFDTVCAITELQYAIFHASVDSREGLAIQEYFIRHVNGYGFNTESEMERLGKCLKAAVERRVSEGVRLELCGKNRVGLLSDITRVLRENGLAVVRADVASRGDKAVNAFYVRDIYGNSIDMDLVKSMTSEMGSIDQIAFDNESESVRPSSNSLSLSLSAVRRSTSFGRTRTAIGEFLKSGIVRFLVYANPSADMLD